MKDMTGGERIDAIASRTPLADPSHQRAFAPGQRVIGRVLETRGADQFLLAIGGERLVARSAVSLAPGQDIALEVMKAAGSTIEMRVVPLPPASPSEGAATAEQRFQLAALVTAVTHGSIAPRAGSDLRALLDAAERLVTSEDLPLTASELDGLTRVLTPQDTGGDGASLAARLRAAFENGGQLFEAHLRRVFDSHPGLSEDQALERVRDDARTLLGRAMDALSVAASQDAATARAQLDGAAAQILARQAQAGLHWLANETVVLKMPVALPSGDAEAAFAVRRDPDDDAHGAGGRPPGFSVTFRITSEVLGPVDARVSWRGGALSATISVDNVEAKELLLPELPTFRQGLQDAFPQVYADLVIDAARVHAPRVDDAVPQLPGGSIVNVRA